MMPSMWQLYKYQPLNRIVLGNLVQRKLWASYPSAFNDPFEFRLQRVNQSRAVKNLREQNPRALGVDDATLIREAVQGYQARLNSMGLICFTEVQDDISMWSHYADSHQGICLGFCGQNESQKPEDIAIYPVNYSDECPELDFAQIWDVHGMAKILWTKNKCWAHEKEWRLIRINGNVLEGYPGRLNKVIFGLRTTEVDLKLVQVILEDEKDLKYFRVVQDDNMYRLNIEAI